MLKGHDSPVNSMCAANLMGHQVLVSASDDGTIRLWDPDDDWELLSLIPVHHPAKAVEFIGPDVLVVGLAAGHLALQIRL